ncbi:MAG: chemotaxis protein CheA [Pseudomonadota bacterium]
MNDINGAFDTLVDKLAMQLVMVEPGDKKGFGDVMHILTSLDQCPLVRDVPGCGDLLKAMQDYINQNLLNGQNDMSLLEQGVALLQDMGRAAAGRFEFQETSELASLVKRLCLKPFGTGPESEKRPGAAEPGTQLSQDPDKVMTEEDIQILGDFTSEAMENLESIELNLIDLEQDSEDAEIINSIFRPFHTIKGVSGFLNLEKINTLAHSTENLLDSVRKGEFPINAEIIDIILASVDILKQLVRSVEEALSTGSPRLEGTVEVIPLIHQIEAVQKRFAKISAKPLGAILLDRGEVTQQALNQCLTLQESDSPARRIGEILIDSKAARPKAVLDAVRDQKQGKRTPDQKIKVDTSKLDNLVDQAGELVIAQAMLRQHDLIAGLRDQKLLQTLGQITQGVSSIQKTAMSMRMVDIGSTFNKMHRLVRDLARNSGKRVNLEMYGQETEIDRTVVEELYDPLVHMMRNAVDHGLEPPEERERTGKNKTGRIQIQALHKGGNVVIEITDDGKGLDKQEIIEKAIKTGLIKDSTGMTEAQIFNLISKPGFSTAKQITEVSGRGVGMDVVKQGIEKLRGHLDIRSEPGRGTTFTISLPLTLAIIDGMIVRVSSERYIIPTMTILESFRPLENNCYTVEGKAEMVLVRENLIPLIRLSIRFGLNAARINPWEALVVVVESQGSRRALLIDELIGKEEVVIKSLGDTFQDIKGLAGGAILGDGKIGLILDIAGLIDG